LYIADTNNHALRKMVLSTGDVTTLAGALGVPGFADGYASSARFAIPVAVWANTGSVYVADLGNRTIRKFDKATGQVSTVAGKASESPSSVDGVGTAARFIGPTGLWGDGTYLYVADAYGPGKRAIRKFELASGNVTTVSPLRDASELQAAGIWGDPLFGFLWVADGALPELLRIDLTTQKVVEFAMQDINNQPLTLSQPTAIWGFPGFGTYIANPGTNSVFLLAGPGGLMQPAVGAYDPGSADGLGWQEYNHQFDSTAPPNQVPKPAAALAGPQGI
jgi:DNA-binding beta-propeller fold protein YncE